VKHDHLCERVTLNYSAGLTCKCASRAYERDPLPNEWTPVWAEPKTPGQEGG
jgi:hypothetical protein